MTLYLYDREAAVNYAKKFALARNPAYFDFESLGGDCTNFCSQAVFAGARQMNHNANAGWFYLSPNKKSPSWTGVDFFARFLLNNKGQGPFGALELKERIKPGDIVQLKLIEGAEFQHSAIIVGTGGYGNTEDIMICCHSYDRLNFPLSLLPCLEMRFISIHGFKK